jgi:acetolactate synthase-1/2/3 large subunit
MPHGDAILPRVHGAEAAIRTAVEAGVEVCFANPGTTEMALVSALDSAGGIRAVLGLFEGVCTGAADGYGRMAGKPALTLLHLGPGLANGLACLHNARRGRGPIVNLVGEHATWHRAADPPLASDVEALARWASGWVRTSRSAAALPADMAEAIAAAGRFPGSVATLIAPDDCQRGEALRPAARIQPWPLSSPGTGAVEEGARALRSRKPSSLLLGGNALLERGLTAAARIAAATGCRLFCDSFVSRLERGPHLPALERIPYFPDQAAAKLAESAFLVLAGAPDPVTFFGYPGATSSRAAPESCVPVVLARPEEDSAAALEDLAGRLGAKPSAPAAEVQRPGPPEGALTPRALGQAIAHLQPEGMIFVDDAATSGPPYFFASARCPRSTYLQITGGAIGFGSPAGTGAAIACPDRKVLVLEADGSGMYTLQALWTQAREGLDVTTVVCANRSYHVLRIELQRAGITEPGPAASALTDLSRPALDWVSLARGMGVPGTRAERAEELTAALARAFAEPGPHLIEAIL